MLNNISLRSGQTIYNYLDINFDISLAEQAMLLDEDMLQVKYPNNYYLDIGWLPEHDLQGRFVITIFKDNDWDNPVMVKEVRANQVKTFYQQLDEVIEFVDNLARGSEKHVN